MNDPDPSAPSTSLAGQLAAGLRRRLKPAPLPASNARNHALALILLAATPALIAIAAQTTAMLQDRENRRAEAQAASRIATFRTAQELRVARAKIAPMMTRPTVTGLIERLASSLPDGAHVHSLAADAQGAIHAEIDCRDPETVRAALGQDDMLGRLRVIQQGPAADGVRIVMTSGRS